MTNIKAVDYHFHRALDNYEKAIVMASGRIMEKERLGRIEVDQVFINIESSVDKTKQELSTAALIWLDHKMPYLASVSHAIRAQQLNRLFEIFHDEVPLQISFWDMRLLVRRIRKLSVKTSGEILLENIDELLPGLLSSGIDEMDDIA